MTGYIYLDWAILAVSLFNTLALFWLGLTVLLNAERRTWGIWLAGGGLLGGAAFFVSHTAILGHGGEVFSPGMDFWWRVGWAPVAALPYAWYTVMLWYTGFWEKSAPPGRDIRRQRVWFALVSMGTAAIFGLLILANPLPSFSQLAVYNLAATPSLSGIPLLVLVFPVYIVLCMALSLDALRRPGPTARLMGDAARQRAHPWLLAATFVLLVVCLLVGAAMLWIILNVQRGVFTAAMTTLVGWADLVIAALIGLAVVLLGQAVVAYEIFTGKSLPRRALARAWQRALILAAASSVLMAWSLAIHLRQVYGLLLAALLMTAFFALLNWRSFAERERLMANLRPFVASQGLYDRLTETSPAGDSIQAPFRALCADVLGTRRARLAAVGLLAPLVETAWDYCENRSPACQLQAAPLPLASLSGRCHGPQPALLRLEAAQFDGFGWAVPLWGSRGLVGMLLLDDKRDGSPYTQEEIEIAQSAGERLLDAQAGAELARRLMSLQRQRLAQSQVLDRHTRRRLHDDVLPRLHAAMLSLASVPQPPAPLAEALQTLAETHRQVADLLRDLPAAAAPQVVSLGLAGALRQVAESELSGAFESVEWQCETAFDTLASDLSPLETEVLFYAAREAMRNAARHARPADSERPLHLQVTLRRATSLPVPAVEIVIEDNGVGIKVAPARDGGGQGLALHSTLMAVIGGTLAVDSAPGEYTRVTLSLPLKNEG